MSIIKFGTSGWRAILCDDFTAPNVAVAVQAIAEHLKATRHSSKGVLVSFDGRFMGERFARQAAEVLAGNGIRAFVTDRDTPTPVVAFEQLRRKLDGAINFTASHNPYEYGGLKFNPHWGGPATYDITKDIEKKADALFARGGAKAVKPLAWELAEKRHLVSYIDPAPAYFTRLSQLVDTAAIKRAGLKVIADPLHGAGRGYLDEALIRAGAKVTALHTNRDPYFGGGAPEPAEGHIDEMVGMVKKAHAHLGLGTDGDSDRFGVVDDDGSFLMPNLVIALLVHHLHRTRKKWHGPVVRSVVSSSFIDAVAKKYGIEVVETPVGFKWIGQIMTRRDILIGGEESGGLTVFGHVPEKDGVLACMLMAEMRAIEKRPFRAVLKQLYAEVGSFIPGRSNYRLQPARKEALVKQLAAKPPAAFAGSKVAQHITLDGHKFVLEDGSWLAVRFSGTEPVVRLYLEASSAMRVEQLRKAGAAYILGGKA